MAHMGLCLEREDAGVTQPGCPGCVVTGWSPLSPPGTISHRGRGACGQGASHSVRPGLSWGACTPRGLHGGCSEVWPCLGALCHPQRGNRKVENMGKRPVQDMLLNEPQRKAGGLWRAGRGTEASQVSCVSSQGLWAGGPIMVVLGPSSHQPCLGRRGGG